VSNKKEEGNPSFILGSGPSIFDLNEEQKRWLSMQPFVFAMNKYLMFWDKVGIHPSHFFLIDTHFPAYAVLEKSIARKHELKKPVKFCLGYRFRPFVNQGLFGKFRNFYALKKVTKNDRRYTGRFLEIESPLFFDHQTNLFKEHKWAESLSEPLYYFRGSLTILLNLITILNPRNPIYLLGVDMNTNRTFYDEELQADPLLRDNFHVIGEKTGKHPTVVEMKVRDGRNVGGLLDKWEFIQKSCELAGCPIYNCNSQSLLVESGLCEYSPIPALSSYPDMDIEIQ